MSVLKERYRTIEVYGDPVPGGKCIIDSRVHGLFAMFYCVLYGLYICENESLVPVVRLGKDHLYYDPSKGPDIFGYFYEQHDLPDTACCRILVNNPCYFLQWCRNSMSEKRLSNRLISKYFILNEPIEEELEHFYDTHMQDRRILGVHYRGRDKVTETGLVPFREYEVKIDNLLRYNVCDKVFFVTDELELRKKMVEKYGDKVILYDLEADYSEAEGDSSSGLHFLKTPLRYLMAKDALMECYLLSNCDLFMSSSRSSMSLFATFINPEIPHIILEP